MPAEGCGPGDHSMKPGHEPVVGHCAGVGHGEPPAALAPRHPPRRAELDGARRDDAVDVVGAHDPADAARRGREPCLDAGIVETEPAPVRHRRRVGVDRDQLEEARIADGDDAVVRAHVGMLAARRDVDAERLAQRRGARFQRRRADRDMVEGDHRRSPSRCWRKTVSESATPLPHTPRALRTRP
jgi:hypothetical protein